LQSSSEQCAREVLDVIPLVMRVIRGQFRKHGTLELSVPQFRALHFLSQHRGASLSEVAEYIGLMLPSMSTLVDGLVTRNFAVRRTSPNDRRRMTLTLTERGQATLRSARGATQTYLAEQLNHLAQADRVTIIKAMQALRPIFTEKAT
jgi:MarR family transcriptional regulator for hemolysin